MYQPARGCRCAFCTALHTRRPRPHETVQYRHPVPSFAADCNDILTFVDLDGTSTDPTAYAYQYTTTTGVWAKTAIVSMPCPDPDQGGLLPRTAGYTVGQTIGPLGDRLLVLGGSDGENNVSRVPSRCA